MKAPRTSATLDEQIAAAERAVLDRRLAIARRTAGLTQGAGLRLLRPGSALALLGLGVRVLLRRHAASLTAAHLSGASAGRVARALGVAGRGLQSMRVAEVARPLLRLARKAMRKGSSRP